MHRFEDADLKGRKFGSMPHWECFYPSYKFAAANSLPTTYEKGGVNIVLGDNARNIPESDFSFGTILDLPAAELLMKRGIDVGIETLGEVCSDDMPYI